MGNPVLILRNINTYLPILILQIHIKLGQPILIWVPRNFQDYQNQIQLAAKPLNPLSLSFQPIEKSCINQIPITLKFNHHLLETYVEKSTLPRSEVRPHY